MGADNATFRKGLVFGLTLAEIMLLLVFMLLLALGALLKHAEARADALQAQADRALAAEQRLTEALARQSSASSPQQIQEWVRELVASAAGSQEAKSLREQLQKASSALTRVDTAAVETQLLPPSPPAKPSTSEERRAETETRWEKATSSVSDAMAELRGLRSANVALQKISDGEAAKQLTNALIENERMKGTVAYSQRRLAELGRGTERPPCWANAQGRPEYIFAVGLSQGGITLRDRARPHRRQQQALLPIRTISFDRPLSPAEFRAQTRPLFDWGEAHECRFFVLATDRTGPAQKEIFKLRLRVMEEHFYKFLEN